MTDWTNYRNPGNLNPFDMESFRQGYSQYGQGSPVSSRAQSPASSRPQTPASSRAESKAPSPELQVLRDLPSGRKSAHQAGRPPRAPSLLQKLRKMSLCSSSNTQVDTRCIRTKNQNDRSARNTSERITTRADYAQGSSSAPYSVEVYDPYANFYSSTSVMPESPGTRDEHEMLWHSMGESQFTQPFDMPTLQPLSPSPWDEWMRQDDLALQEAEAAYGAANIASTSHAYNVESAQAQQARSDLMGTLNSALADLERLVNSNADPELAGYPIKQLDRQITPLLIAAENWRRLNLNLIALHTSEAATVDSDDEDMDEQAPMAGSQEIDDFVRYSPHGRYRALIDNGQHTRVADIHKSESGVSVILLDPLRVEEDETAYDDYAVKFKQDFGTHAAAKCAFVPLDLQKSAFGCRIFSMSLALKMQAREGEFTNMHSALYSGDLSPVVPGSMQTEDDEDAHVVLDAGPLIDASMLKHNQSRSSIKKYLRENPDQDGVIVNNKHGETLRTRTKRHTVDRKVPAKKESGRKTKTITFNNSIELKRIALVKRALNFVSVAPSEDVIQLSALIN